MRFEVDCVINCIFYRVLINFQTKLCQIFGGILGVRIFSISYVIK